MIETGLKTAVHRHLYQNGITESPHLRLATDLYDFDPNVVWVDDLGPVKNRTAWCRDLAAQVENAKKRRVEQGLSPSWPIVLNDFNDYWRRTRCSLVKGVRYAKRSIVKSRHFSNNTQWVDVGERVPLLESDGTVVQHVPFFVRTDTVEGLAQILESRRLTLASPLERLDRPVDVSHFWPVDGQGIGSVHSQLRTRVSRLIQTLPYHTLVGLRGPASQAGRTGVHTAYLEGLLASKIVVVTQRDEWEDHYRLFEALVSGALVLTDRMLSLPEGYENGTSIVEFESAENLVSLIRYYLEHEEERWDVARRGRELAMSRHRSWHRMEELIFGAGKVRSKCGGPPCPYVVHANETQWVE